MNNVKANKTHTLDADCTPLVRYHENYNASFMFTAK